MYPRSLAASQVLGAVGWGGRGLSGLEYRYDHVLRGSDEPVWKDRLDVVWTEVGQRDRCLDSLLVAEHFQLPLAQRFVERRSGGGG